MQEQTKLRKTEPQQKDGQADRSAVDPCWQHFDQIRNLPTPIRDFCLILSDHKEKTLQAVSGLGQITAQKIGCITDKSGGLLRHTLRIGNLGIQRISGSDQVAQYLIWHLDVNERQGTQTFEANPATLPERCVQFSIFRVSFSTQGGVCHPANFGYHRRNSPHL